MDVNRWKTEELALRTMETGHQVACPLAGERVA